MNEHFSCGTYNYVQSIFHYLKYEFSESEKVKVGVMVSENHMQISLAWRSTLHVHDTGVLLAQRATLVIPTSSPIKITTTVLPSSIRGANTLIRMSISKKPNTTSLTFVVTSDIQPFYLIEI